MEPFSTMVYETLAENNGKKETMNLIYKSKRIGKNGVPFIMYKIRTLKENTDKASSFAGGEQYTRFGRFLRKTKLDELPQIWNVIKRDLNLVGPRAEEQKTISLIPQDIQKILLSRRPGLTSLASLHFFDEGQILEKSHDPSRIYWTEIKPNKIVLDIFYIQNRDIFLDFWIIYRTILLVIKSFFVKL